MTGFLKCPECGALFCNEEDMKAHFEAWHKPTGPYFLTCPKCGKKLESRAALEEHLRRHPEEEGVVKNYLQFEWEEEEEEEYEED